MNLSLELVGFVISVVIQLVSVGIFIGVYKTTINFMQREIASLKEDLKSEMINTQKYLERLIKCESNISAIWLKLDGWKEK